MIYTAAIVNIGRFFEYSTEIPQRTPTRGLTEERKICTSSCLNAIFYRQAGLRHAKQHFTLETVYGVDRFPTKQLGTLLLFGRIPVGPPSKHDLYLNPGVMHRHLKTPRETQPFKTAAAYSHTVFGTGHIEFAIPYRACHGPD